MSRVAAVDCGTNSLRLLIADVEAGSGTLADVERRTEIVRLGQGVDRTGRFDPHALARTLAVARDYADLCRAAGVGAVRFVATSATRDAADRDVFVDAVREMFGVEPEVVSGTTEARLSFEGATGGLPGVTGDTEVLVVDLGGGSTEIVRGSPTRGVEEAVSLDIGSVRLFERHDGRAGAAEADISEALDRAGDLLARRRAAAVVGLAGTVATVTAYALGLERYDSARVHGARLPLVDVVRACDRLVAMDVAQRLALSYVPPGRADVIGMGALVWQRVLERVHADAGTDVVLTSEHDILDGMAWSLARSSPTGSSPARLRSVDVPGVP